MRLLQLFLIVTLAMPLFPSDATTTTKTSNAKPAALAGLGASRLLAGTPQEFLSACTSDLDAAKANVARVKAMKAPRDPIAVLEALDDAGLVLNSAGSRAGLGHEVSPSEPLRKAAEQCESDVSAYGTEMSLDRGLYDALSALDGSKLDTDTKYYLDKTIRDFRRAGVDRDEATRARVKTLNDELVTIGQEFARNIAQGVLTLEVEPTDLAGLPDDFVRSHPAGPNGKVTLKTDNTDFIPFMRYANNEKARERFWRLYMNRAYPKNEEVLSHMLQKRYELAQLLGYKTWAQYITEDKMIGSDKNAADFIEKITEASGARMKRDYQDLLARAQKDDPKATAVHPWSTSYLSEKIKIEKFGSDSQAVRPYFEYSRVKQGLLDITRKMFGIDYRKIADAKVWAPDVEAYDVLEKGKLLGRIYFDMFPRENKYKHYATFGLTSGKLNRALPEGVLVCNFPRPGAEPALMLHSDVVTFFHEYGHLLASILGGQPRLAGPGVQWDFVEAPSQMLEEWVWDPAVLQTFAKHYKTGEAIPADTIKRMKAADDFGRGLGVRQQMYYAAMSLNFYNRPPQDVDMTKLSSQLQERYTPFKSVAGTHMQDAFGHLDGYSAIYYTYMWSLVIAKDMFTVFKHDGLLNPAPAARYRHSILEPMNQRPSAQIVQDFLGRPYSFKAYEDWLNGAAE